MTYPVVSSQWARSILPSSLAFGGDGFLLLSHSRAPAVGPLVSRPHPCVPFVVEYVPFAVECTPPVHQFALLFGEYCTSDMRVLFPSPGQLLSGRDMTKAHNLGNFKW